jgi:oligoribonuclease NrnB/cAMP/cGMP phosphodiesterase (DHH superfamily)
MLPVINVIHHNDADGHAAAYAIWYKYGNTHQINLYPTNYGQDVPTVDVDAEKTFVVDFSYDVETCDHLNETLKGFRLFDHHDTENTKALSCRSYAIIDKRQAGCGITWSVLHPGKPLPIALRYIQDRDMWKFELEDSDSINMYIFAYVFDLDPERTIANIHKFDFGEALMVGKGMKRFRDTLIEMDMKRVKLVTDFCGHVVPMVNATSNISELGQRMCEEYQDSPFSVSYMANEDGSIKYSLRSIGDFHVGELCETLGGGGHKNAAGFIRKLGVFA